MKRITIPTNYNNKLSTNCFLHIDVAPRQGVPEATMKETVIDIWTKDGSHPPVQARLVDLCRLPLFQLPALATFQSHGMDAETFRTWFMDQNKVNSIITPMAIYYYQKIEQ